MSLRIAVVPGDGIGVEVTREATKALQAVADAAGKRVVLTHFEWGADHYLKTGETLPDGAPAMLQDRFDAILLGAMGDPRVPDGRHAADILLGLRSKLDLFVHYRPVKLLHQRLCPLRERTPSDVDFVVLRENTEGLGVLRGGSLRKDSHDEVATELDLSTRKGVERIIRHAFEHARRAGKSEIVMADRSSGLLQAHDLWQRAFKAVSAENAAIAARQLSVGELCVQLVRDPGQFQVIVTSNLLGDVVSGLAAGLQGGRSMAASGDIHPGRLSLFEPVHDSSPALAGRNLANPTGAILSAALLLEHCGWSEEAQRVEGAVRWAVDNRRSTADIGGTLGTREAGETIAACLR